MAKALRAPLAAGDLDGALAAAREIEATHPVVHALELLLQTALGHRAPSLPEAARLLGAGQLLPALAAYQRASSGDTAPPIDAIRCVLRATEEPLTMSEEPEPTLEQAPPEQPTPAAAPADLPSREVHVPQAPVLDGGMLFDDETRAIPHPVIPTQAYRDEPTMQVRLSDFQPFDEGPDETTRVAKPGELPLEELRKQVAEDSDAAIDGLLKPGKPPSKVQTLDAGPQHAVAPPLATPPERRGPSVPRAPTFQAPPEPRGSPPPAPAPGPDTERPPFIPRGSHPSPPGFVPPPAPPAAASPAAAPERPTHPPRLPDPPIPPVAALRESDPVHAPLDTDLSLPAEDHWSLDARGGEDSGSGAIVSSEQSWVGLRAFDADSASFQPAVDPMATDNWADEVPTDAQATALEPASVQQAEALVAQGALGAALGMYQDLAASRPDDPRLWQRIEQIARALQRESTPPE